LSAPVALMQVGLRGVRWRPGALLAAALVGVSLASLSMGAAGLSLGGVAAALGWPGAEASPVEQAILLHLRLPRLLLALAVGAALATSGALMQGLFRNPLADPGLLGVSGGAALGAAVGLLAVGRLPELQAWLRGPLVPACALLGGLGAVTAVTRLSRGRAASAAVLTMLLAGLAVEALSRAGVGLAQLLANDQELRDLTFWMLGSLGGATWPRLAWILPVLGAGVLLSQRLAPSLDALLLGEAEAAHVGIDVPRTKLQVVLLTSALVGCTVALTGAIAFVGLVVPHLVRLSGGPAHRRLLPRAAAGGALLVAAADLAARTLAAPAEIPIGVLTALLGAPFFLVLLRRQGGASC
jgi:iron complex transport system permease protein